jgi:hypothetical protein
LDAPVTRLPVRKFDLDIASLIGIWANFQNATNGILFRFDIGEDEHLADVYDRRHPQDGSLRKNDHRYGLLFKRFGARGGAARDFEHPRTMHLDGNLKRQSIGAK